MKEKIIALQKEIEDKIYCLNSGGCGTFAYFVYKTLIKMGYSPKILAFDHEQTIDTKKYHLNNCKNGEDYEPITLTCTHFVVEWNEVIFDGYYTYESIGEVGYGSNIGEYTLEEIKIAVDKGSWNSMYDRCQDNLLFELINKHLGNLPVIYKTPIMHHFNTFLGFTHVLEDGTKLLFDGRVGNSYIYIPV